jgi:hypothetical protein
MTATSRLIVFRLVPEHLNGVWMEVLPGSLPPFWVQDGDEKVELVMTGDVEWDGLDNCAEVVVPVERLGEWRREHADA